MFKVNNVDKNTIRKKELNINHFLGGIISILPFFFEIRDNFFFFLALILNFTEPFMHRKMH